MPMKKDPIRENCMSLEEFYGRMDAYLSVAKPSQYVLVSLDFDNFKYINDLFGYEIGSKTLDAIVNNFSHSIDSDEFFCHVNADNFLLFLNSDSMDSLNDRLYKMTNANSFLSNILPDHYNFVASGGVYKISNLTDEITTMVDCANFARKKAKGNHSSTFFEYSLDMNDELEWRKQITLNMEQALELCEFEMYIQPKVLLKNNCVVGGEALVRWNSKNHGLIYPDKFIPVFEQNGFVILLDFYILEQACIFLRKCMDESFPILPISVNFSKLHIGSTPNFVSNVFDVVNRYGIEPSLIEIELTESVLSRDFDALVRISSEFKKLGFKVSLDDFGNAYSSLNYLKDLPLDIIKLDKGFLDSSTNSEKGRLIIAKVVDLIKSLHLQTVVEGVEHEDQAEFLNLLGCEIGQGYLYARPMQKHLYKIFVNNNLLLSDVEALPTAFELSLYEKPKDFEMDNSELNLLSQTINMGLMKGYLDSDDPKVQYVNKVALDYIGYTIDEFHSQLGNRISAFVHPDDVHIVAENTRSLIANGKPLHFRTRAVHKSGKIITLDGQVVHTHDADGRSVGIYSFQDITAELEKIEQLKINERRYRIISEQSEDIMFEWDFSTDTIWFSDKFEKILGFRPITDHVSTNSEILKLIHPDDMEIFDSWITLSKNNDYTSSIEFRLVTAEGNYLWMRNNSTTLSDENGNKIKSIGVFSNITHLRSTIDLLQAKSQQDSLTKAYNKEATQIMIDQALSIAGKNDKSALFILDIDNFKGVNDNLGHQFGDTVLLDTVQKIRSLFRDTDIIGRVGGDEFIIFMRGIPEESTATHKADELVRSLRSSYYGENMKYNISCSIGVAFAPHQGKTFNELYKLSDIALYETKNSGKDGYTIYHDSIVVSDGNSIVRTPLESERFLSTYYESDPVYTIFEMLYETKDMQTTINKIIELAGKRFAVDRVYIFEYNDDNTLCSNTYEWCASGTTPEIDNLQALSTDDMSLFLSKYNSEGIFFCNDIESLDKFSYDTLKPQGIKSLLHCAIYNEGVMKGFIGFDDCKSSRSWRGDEIATLAYIARVLSTFILKKQVSNELFNSYQNQTELLNNLPGYVYVIDRQDYKTLYLNKAIIDLGCTVGQKCYEIAFGTDKPCDNCPVHKIVNNVTSYTSEIFSQRIDGWVSSAASKVTWTGVAEAALVCCTDISKYKSI